MSEAQPNATPEDPDLAAPDERDLDRRSAADRRRGDRRKQALSVPTDQRQGTDRRQGPRRKRSINQYDMDGDVLEFIAAVNHFKERSGRAFPTWSEVLGILRGLGYEKR